MPLSVSENAIMDKLMTQAPHKRKLKNLERLNLSDSLPLTIGPITLVTVNNVNNRPDTDLL